MTFDELYQLRDLTREINEDQKRAEELRNSGDESLIELAESIEIKCDQRNMEYTRIYDFIDSIDDSYLRRIFKLKFIDGLSWAQLARRLGGTTADSARMIVKRYLSH